MKGHSILIVDDEDDILRLLSYNLKKAGLRVIEARDGPEAIELAQKKTPELILLDVMLPNMNGTDVLKSLKRESLTSGIPVIMLTAKGEEVDRILGLELGAEDYITKPFSPREVILRVKAVLKRMGEGPQGEGELVYKGLSVDSIRHIVRLKNKAIELTTTEFRLLSALLKARGRVLTRDRLLDMAWGEDCYVTQRTVDTHIRRLRAKLQSYGKFIETVRGVGYRFTDS